MIYTDFLKGSGNRKVIEENGPFYILEYEKDMSVSPEQAFFAYFASEMNLRKKQCAIKLDDSGVIIQSGAMQWFSGDIGVKTDVKGAGDFFKKVAGASVTKESAIKPKYEGCGIIVLEPTYKYLLVEDLDDWGNSIIIEDGIFLACEDTVKIKTVARTTISSAALGKEGLFNSELVGDGYAVLESPVPREELVMVELEDDTLKIDGSYAIAWSRGLKFTVERTTKTLIGSAASGEGFVNVYRGTGRVLMAPIRDDRNIMKTKVK